MKKLSRTLKNAGVLVVFFLGSACSGGGQDTFYWYRPSTGVQYFARDHAECIAESDSWPYKAPNLQIPPRPIMYDLRLRKDDDSGIWAFYIPLPGAQPVYVNALESGQWSMNANDYANCMRARGYEDMYIRVKDRRIGTKYCTMAGCVDARKYRSVKTDYNEEKPVGPYASPYYGYQSEQFYEEQFPSYKHFNERSGYVPNVVHGYPYEYNR